MRSRPSHHEISGRRSGDREPKRRSPGKEPDFLEGHRGLFEDGLDRLLTLGVTLKPSRHFYIQARVERNDVSPVQGEFYTQILRLRADYSFSPDLSWCNLIRYDNDFRVPGAQSRFRWILKPGNDLFLMVSYGWEELNDRFLRLFDKNTVKFQYTFRL